MATTRLCSLPECRNQYRTNGFCNVHYLRWRKWGNPKFVAILNTPAPPSERFWRKVSASPTNEGCLVWNGARDACGYGTFMASRKRGIVRAHRFAWETVHGPIPTAAEICHRCDNPPCVRVDHLFLSTHAGNMTDMKAKGRSARGVTSGAAKHAKKLTAEAAREIRQRYASDPTLSSRVQIASDYGVSRWMVDRIVEGKAWAHA